MNKIKQPHLCGAKREFHSHRRINNFQVNIMGNLLYLIAVLLIIGWAIGFVGFHLGGLIHILLVIALISIILRVIQGNNAV
jgi:uncharacterized membrane protein YkgB